MEFIKEITEARMTRDSSNQRVLTYTDCCERTYLSLLALEFMRNFPSYTSFVQDYCKKSRHHNYQHFKISGTDLYNLIYFIRGDEHALGKLKDPGAAKRMQASIAWPKNDVADFLSKVGSGLKPTNINQMFIRLENGLDIPNTDYKNNRRSLTNFSRLSNNDKKTLATRILYALRAKLRNSDIIDDFSKLVAGKGLESNWVDDTEPTVSSPDIKPTTSADYVYYRLLAKPENLILIKGFLEYMRAGKPIPGNMVRAYQPVAKAMDDIVRAGPSYINMLRSIQNRAKNSVKS